jgi:hypothetical protein
VTEQEIKKLVFETIEDEVTRAGGVLDQCQSAALSFVLAAIDLKFRNLRAEIGLGSDQLQ